jgi:pimeloyl-ACP methyl ester carboxylesterase
VLVHGVTGWHRTWWRVGPALAAAGYRVVAVDQRGHGHSPRLRGSITVRDLAADLATVVGALGGRADLLVGHSLGGAAGLELAVAHPALVGRLVLEDPPAISRVGDEGWLINVQRECAAAVSDPEGEVARTLDRNPTWLQEDARQDVEGKQLADVAGLLASFQADIGTRVLHQLPEVSIPTLLLLGEEARSVFPRAARLSLDQQALPNVRRLVLDAGHTIHRDRFEDFVHLVVDWASSPAG